MHIPSMLEAVFEFIDSNCISSDNWLGDSLAFVFQDEAGMLEVYMSLLLTTGALWEMREGSKPTMA